MFGLFKNKEGNPKLVGPSIMGLRIGCSFELDSLMLKLVKDDYVASGMANTQIIQAAGEVELSDTHIFRFYTDDDAFLQVVTQGGTEDHHVIDVKLFHYYKTVDVSSQASWDRLLREEIGNDFYMLGDESLNYKRVWETEGNYLPPVHMNEKTTDANGEVSHTDQFTMLFEREIGENGQTESLFVSAEEMEGDNGQLTRCLVLSTGMTLSPANLTIHG